jgi:hypothetical protein
MTINPPPTGVVATVDPRTRCKRDKFEFYEGTPLFAAALARLSERAKTSDPEISTMDCGELIARYGEDAVHEKLRALAEAHGGTGATTTVLFAQPPPIGWILIHAWFGPGYLLPRHSHPADGDCLYYVLAGQAVLGNRVLGPGDGFYVPNEHPYKFRAGPEGLEILEFRGGYGIKGAPRTRCHETSLEAFDSMIEAAQANRHLWDAPSAIYDRPVLMKSGEHVDTP